MATISLHLADDVTGFSAKSVGVKYVLQLETFPEARSKKAQKLFTPFVYLSHSEKFGSTESVEGKLLGNACQRG